MLHIGCATIQWHIFSSDGFSSHALNQIHLKHTACSHILKQPQKHMLNVCFHALFYTHTMADGVICDGGVRPRTVTFWHSVFALAGAQTLSRTHTLGHRPRLLEAPCLVHGYICMFDYTALVCVCVWLSLALIRTEHNQQHRAAGVIWVRWRKDWLNNIHLFLFFLFFFLLCIAPSWCINLLVISVFSSMYTPFFPFLPPLPILFLHADPFVFLYLLICCNT